tara:strand:- start:55 stop:603 length:549 start_codon:yes stop_codon:yes gene_type:complete
MDKKLFITRYIKEFCEIVNKSENEKKKIVKIYDLLDKIKSNNSVHVFGNGGSSSIASHFSMDLTNNSNVKSFCYNDTSTITCYSNDFGYENWISRVIKKFGKKGDILVLISSSGKSRNMINGLKEAKKKKFKKIISFTGFDKTNYLNKNCDLGIWINSKKYNLVENTHQFLLLLIVDMFKNS